RRGTCRAIVAGLLVMFMAATGAHLLWAAAPDYQCFGAIDAFFQRRTGAIASLRRNAFLLGLILCSVLLSSPVLDWLNPGQDGTLSRERNLSGLTLLECIFVLVVVMIVAAISLPSLYHALNSRKAARSLGQIKQHATAITAYVLSGAD